MPQPLPPRLSIVPLTNTLAGVVDALTHLPEWKGVLAASELDQRIVFRREPPFSLSGSHSSSELVGKPVRDRDLDRIRHWFEEVMGCALSKQHVIDAARIAADDNAFHPVRDYLSGLTWDGRPRVDRWLEDYCAVVPASEPHAELIRSVARRWLVACVARAMKPGSGKNPRVTARVSQLLSTLGFERRKRSALPRTYHYARTSLRSPSDVPPSPRPTSMPQPSLVP